MTEIRPRWLRRAAALLAAGALVGGACSSGDDADGGDGASDDGGSETGAPALPDGYEGYESELYGGDANWLCKPGLADDVCHRDLDATVVQADGSTEVERHRPADDPPVDCFYVYPTTSADEGPNSDLEPGDSEEISTVYNQAARLTASCRVFAPVYRQATLSTIGGGSGGDADDSRSVAYGDVLDAFRQYVVHESDGRGFVLVGHSQGANLLNRLVQEEIDSEPRLRDRLVSAMLIGWPVSVPEGEPAGGDFANVPLCESADQTGCIVSYESFRSTAPPPPEGSLFGRSRTRGQQAACTNPASLGGGAATLRPYFVVDQAEGALLGGTGDAVPFADPARTSEITTPFVTYADFVSAECVHEGEYTYLALTVEADPADARTDDIGGDLTPEWGMHLIDVNVAMGDLVDLVASQGEAYADRG